MEISIYFQNILLLIWFFSFLFKSWPFPAGSHGYVVVATALQLGPKTPPGLLQQPASSSLRAFPSSVPWHHSNFRKWTGTEEPLDEGGRGERKSWLKTQHFTKIMAWWLSGKESACNVGDVVSIPGSGRYPGKIKWQPTPVFLPGKSYGLRSLVGYSPWGRKSWTPLSD